MRLRGTNATGTEQTSKQSDEASIAPPSDDLIDALKKAQIILSRDTVRKGDKSDIQQTIGRAIDQMIAMKEELKECREQLGKQSTTDDNTCLSDIKNQLAKLTKAIMEPPQTYAQAIQRNTANNARNVVLNHPLHPAPGIKERTEQLRQERAKTEVTLTTHEATDNMKNQLTNMSDEALTNNLQQAITAAGMEHIKIRGIQKTPNHRLKILCATDKEADELRSMDWKKALEGVDVVKTLYGVVIHGVSKHDIDFTKDTPKEIMARIRGGNSEDITAERVVPLRRRTRNPNAPTQSIVIFFKSAKEADDCIEMGIHIEHRYYATTERYTLQCRIKQCFNCQKYGHKASECTRKARCGKCTQEHETKECQSETALCANCKGPHYAWVHECPHRQQRREEGETLRNQLPHLYTS